MLFHITSKTINERKFISIIEFGGVSFPTFSLTFTIMESVERVLVRWSIGPNRQGVEIQERAGLA